MKEKMQPRVGVFIEMMDETHWATRLFVRDENAETNVLLLPDSCRSLAGMLSTLAQAQECDSNE